MGKNDKQYDHDLDDNQIEPKDSTRSRLRSFVSVLIVVFVIAGGVATIGYFISSPDNKPGVSSTQNTVEPDKEVVLPSGKNIDDLGGWKRVSPPESEPVFAYNDDIKGVEISVSQQKLPPTFQTNTSAKIEELAKNYNATTKIEAGSDIAYIGTSAKGPQSVILVKNGLLILLKSTSVVEEHDWSVYIKGLYSPNPSSIPVY